MYTTDSPLYNTALKYYYAGRLVEAEELCRQVLQQQPDCVEAMNLLGIMAYQKNKLEESISYYQNILTIQPDHYKAHNNLGNVLQAQGKLDAAVNSYQQALAFKPDYFEACSHLGNVFHEQGKLQEAIASFQQALSLNPNYPEAYNNLGNVFQSQEKLEKAIAYYQKALDIKPNYNEAYNNLGTALKGQGRLEESLHCFNRALENNPDYQEAHWNRAIALLSSGDLKRGFAEYDEYRWRVRSIYFKAPDCFPKPIWDGSNLDGKIILLHTDDGFGDTIQFIRYAPLVAQRGGRVILACPKPLMRLLTTIPGIEQLLEGKNALPEEFHVHAPLLSLPHCLGTTLESIPNHIPYITLPNSENWAASNAPFLPEHPPGTLLKVGFVWATGGRERSGDLTANDKRSCPSSLFLKLLSLPGICLYSLQVGRWATEINEFNGENRLQNLSSQIEDFADTAALIDQLDLVISVDTGVVHLAGAMGRPVWTLLAFDPDWRWMRERENSPWYPSMRLFRQQQSGDWESVFEQVVQALHNHLAI